MESMVMCDLPSWVLDSEEDFPLGAKATPFLPSATTSNALSENFFELPEWMENREIVGLDSVELFNGADFLQALKCENSEILDHGPEDIASTIKPEDMLVPLSELQPHTSTPKGLSANPAPGGAQAPVAKNINGCMVLPISQLQPQISTRHIISSETKPRLPAPIPKIIICKKVATRSPQKELRKYHTVPDIQLISSVSSPYVQNQENPAPTDSNTSTNMCDADNLITEMVQMIGHNDIASVENSAFNSMIQANMDDLLFQLESENSQLKESSESSLSLEPASPISLPSPVPSTGSLSPHSTHDFLFAAALSPSEKSCESSPSGTEDFDNCFGQLEVHSYSKSPLKKKASRKSSSRKSPYADDRKERKKEQNKQAALRYRQKKKQEDDVIMAKIHAEEERQRELRIKHTKLKQELSCFKKIMRDLFTAKGVLSEDAFKKK